MSNGCRFRSQPPACSVCGKVYLPRLKRGFCNAHYKRFRRYGDPLGVSAIRAPSGEPSRFLQEVVLSFEGAACLAWPYAKSDLGYGHIMQGGKQRIVSRVVCEMVHGSPPTPQHDAAHSCGKGHEGCVNPHHLSWKTRAENMADKIVHGTSARGEAHGNAKLTASLVAEIRSLKGKHIQRDLARMFNVSRSNINFILTEQTWCAP